MDTNWTFLKIISLLADLITIAGIIVAIIISLKKYETLLSFRISLFIHYLFRAAVILLLVTILFKLTDYLYSFILLFIKGDDTNLYWEKGKALQHILSYFISYVIGLSFFWIICSFIWTSSWNYAKEFVNLFLPKNKLLLKHKPVLEIIHATYGSYQNKIDVTQNLRDRVFNNRLTILSSNDIAGDPHMGVRKILEIDYRIGQKLKKISIDEGITQTIQEE